MGSRLHFPSYISKFVHSVTNNPWSTRACASWVAPHRSSLAPLTGQLLFLWLPLFVSCSLDLAVGNFTQITRNPGFVVSNKIISNLSIISYKIRMIFFLALHQLAWRKTKVRYSYIWKRIVTCAIHLALAAPLKGFAVADNRLAFILHNTGHIPCLWAELDPSCPPQTAGWSLQWWAEF